MPFVTAQPAAHALTRAFPCVAAEFAQSTEVNQGHHAVGTSRGQDRRVG